MEDSSSLTLTGLLSRLAAMPDDPEVLAPLALALGSEPGSDFSRYIHELDRIGNAVAHDLSKRLAQGSDEGTQARLEVLKQQVAEKEEFCGDTETYDDPQNANLARVIDRRRGLPIALGIVYLHVGHVAGVDIEGLNFPGHFLLRLDHGPDRLIFDPFNACAILAAPDLRALLKKIHGPRAELSADYTRSVSNREILIRLQNNVKKRQISDEDYTGAIRTIETMRLMDPDEFRLLLDAGVLYARVGQSARARAALEQYLTHFPPGHPHRVEAEQVLSGIPRE